MWTEWDVIWFLDIQTLEDNDIQPRKSWFKSEHDGKAAQKSKVSGYQFRLSQHFETNQHGWLSQEGTTEPVQEPFKLYTDLWSRVTTARVNVKPGEDPSNLDARNTAFELLCGRFRILEISWGEEKTSLKAIAIQRNGRAQHLSCAFAHNTQRQGFCKLQQDIDKLHVLALSSLWPCCFRLPTMVTTPQKKPGEVLKMGYQMHRLPGVSRHLSWWYCHSSQSHQWSSAQRMHVA